MRRYTVEVKGKDYVVDVEELTTETFRVVLDDTSLEVRLRSHVDLAQAEITPAITPVQTVTAARPLGAAPPSAGQANGNGNGKAAPAPVRIAAPAAGSATQTAPMPGVIVSVEVAEGDAVKRGQTVVVLEAMKMNNAIKASRDGVIAAVCVQPNQAVAHGDVLVRYAEA